MKTNPSPVQAVKYAHLTPWTRPANYLGAEWHGWYLAYGRNRDSDILTNSNFDGILAALKELPDQDDGEGNSTLQVVCENHWACGWVEWIAIHESDAARLGLADELRWKLEDYSVLDEYDFSQREYEAYQEAWQDWGESDFRSALKTQFNLSDTASDLLYEYRDELQPFYESLVSSGEYYTSEGSGVSLNVRIAANHCSRDEMAAFLRSLRKPLTQQSNP